MKSKFVFDNKTGTLKPSDEVIMEQAVSETPKFEDERAIVSGTSVSNADDEKLEKLRKYADELGIYNILMFRSQADYTICQIIEERTGKTMAYIGGYALDIKFNMKELNTVERVEQCLDGIKKLFRSMIVEQAIENR